MLNRAQAERVEQIVNLWLSYIVKVDGMNRIIKGSPQDRGVRSSGSAKPDVISGKAGCLRRFQITTDEWPAVSLMKRLTARERELLYYWPAVRRQHNGRTQKQWTLVDVAAEFKLMVSEYRQQRDLAAFHLLELDAVHENGSI
jgi:hypothetical protein